MSAPAAAAPLVALEGLRKAFDGHEVLKGISLSVERGQVTALIGPSGSGKSTLLRCINLLTVPDAGRITVDGRTLAFDGRGRGLPGARELARLRTATGMVFQHFNLFSHMTALQNVMEGPVTVLGTPRAQAAEEARVLLDRVGLLARADAMPDKLSGGQKQRVAIARALAMRPSVMLFDEATSALDPALVGEVLAVIRELARDGMTMLLVTHEIGFARDVADEIVFMRDGVVVEAGPPGQVIDRPREEATRAFLGRFEASQSAPGGRAAPQAAA